MMSNLLILPMLLPFLCALILVFIKDKSKVSKFLCIGTMLVTTPVSYTHLTLPTNREV